MRPLLRGVLPMLVTPFDADGRIAEDELEALVEHQLLAGVTGVSALGLAGEAGALTERERTRVLRRVVAAAGDAPVVAGCTAADTGTAARLAETAVRDGAKVVMVAPPERPDWSRDAMLEHYAAVADAADPTPVMVQDAPTFLGVALDTEFVIDLSGSRQNVTYVKPESVPAADAVAALAPVEPLGVFGGHGGLYFLEVLEVGADGLIPGCDQPEAFQEVFDAWEAGAHGAARDRFLRLLPLLVWQFQSLECFIASVKTLLHAKGLVSQPSLRGQRWPLGARSEDILMRHAATAGAVPATRE
jgi:4-hydroxy-tetrahydrodipicolinate synthase